MKPSVIVCTFNRADLLRETLLALRNQEPCPDGYEIVVVDNNSTDATRAVTEQLAAEPGVPIRYVFEGVQGLSFARNAGIRASTGDVIAFVDDDVDVVRGWVHAISSPLSDAGVACTGGPIRPMWPLERPTWLTKDWEGYIGITEFESARASGEFQYPTYPWGLNIAFRRGIFDEVGLFPTDLGRIGKGLLSNEEVSVCRKIDEAGYRILFVADAIIFHKIHIERLTKQSFYHRAYYQGRSDAILDQRSRAGPYSRAKGFANALFWGRMEPSSSVFDARCKHRLIIGYVSQVTGLHDSTAGPIAHRKLRALKTFVSAMLDTSTRQVKDRQHHLEVFESLVKDRQHQLEVLESLVHEYDTLKGNVWVRLLKRLGLL